MFLRTQMLCIIVNDALIPYVLKVGFIVKLQVKEIGIWNLCNAILSKFNFLTALNNKIKLLFQLSENVSLNETIIISNRKVFGYEHKEGTNGKNIINFMINKTGKSTDRQRKHQRHWY